MVRVLGHDHLRQQACARRALFNWLRRFRCRSHRAVAGVLHADVFDHRHLRRDVFITLADFLADLSAVPDCTLCSASRSRRGRAAGVRASDVQVSDGVRAACLWCVLAGLCCGIVVTIIVGGGLYLIDDLRVQLRREKGHCSSLSRSLERPLRAASNCRNRCSVFSRRACSDSSWAIRSSTICCSTSALSRQLFAVDRHCNNYGRKRF